MNLPEPEPISPTAENIAFARSVARAHYGVPLPGEIVAGRELDTLIAKKVMGWSRLTYFERYGPAHHDTAYGRATRTPHWHSADGKEQAQVEPSGDYYASDDAWSPSSDIADAWQVLRHCVERFGIVELRWDMEDHGREPGDMVWVNIPESPNGPVTVFDNAPLAICRAALAAIGH